MKNKLAILYSFLFVLFTFSAHAGEIKDFMLVCDLIETPTSTHDSWNLYVLSSRISFFDNDHHSLGMIEGVSKNDYVEYFGRDIYTPKTDPWEWKVKMGYRQEYTQVVYAEFSFRNKHRPEIFECRSPKNSNEEKLIREIFEEFDQSR